MKALVIYRSKTGFTHQYAEWIGKELSADILESSKVTLDRLSDYDTIIYGGGLYAAGINGVKLITKNLTKLAGKKVIVFATGASPSRKEVLQEVRSKNFTPEQQQQIHLFYLRGGFDFRRLKPLDKVLMLILKLKLKSKKRSDLSPDERGMLEAYGQPADFTRKRNIDGLIAFARSAS